MRPGFDVRVRPPREIRASARHQGTMKLEAIVKRLLAMPETVEAPHFEARSFRVGGRIFATLPPDGEHLHLMLDPPTARAAAAGVPDVASELWWGKQLAGVRLNIAELRADVLEPLLRAAWRRRAPKRLLDDSDGED